MPPTRRAFVGGLAAAAAAPPPSGAGARRAPADRGRRVVRAPLALLLAAACAGPPLPVDVARVTEGLRDPDAPRVLAVVAHPDDEIAFAGVIYKTATHLGGCADVAVVTNGEGGFKYATLAESIYGLALTDEVVGRRELPAIRRREMLDGARVMNVRDVIFLDQRDHRYTTDEHEILGQGASVWDVEGVRATLAALIHERGYDFLLTFLPYEDTHGHHKAAVVLALQAVASLPEPARPITLGVRFRRRGERPPPPRGLSDWPVTRPRTDVGPFVFDRTQSFGHDDRLDYRIVVNWAIAAHRSQGTMQLGMGRASELEAYWLYALEDDDAIAPTRTWFERLAEPQFEDRTYGPSAGAPRR